MIQYKLRRLFNPTSGRLLDVAVDHGFFGEPAFLTGIADLPAAIATLVEAGPDAIQLTIGQARLLQNRPGRFKPSLVLRADVANVYGADLPERVFSLPIENAAVSAAQLDATCLVVNIFDLPGQPELKEQCIRNVLALRAECTKLYIPLMVEPLVMRANNSGGAYLVDGDIDRITSLVRQAVELGADLIKADPSDDISEYHRVVEVASGIPVLVRGGGRVADDVLLQRTKDVLEQGATGIVYGRNIIQHRDPAGITHALMSVLHENASVEHALTLIGGQA
ncbi:Fructose-bisphosphate aldolase class Ia, DhnA family [Nakamurella panacisegetis]|uniref:Fructose-bisphosphate aldolase class Ia, DhnA family n=1 Tax=Nakamurella panacisegetis TaxID=1090615 RepID=A0A1H0K7Y9_9ACTN|nr:aldolase [Nakamurella panacisegetis]SDO51893.1 Fructose-bisphosphate aldolase class Ia, DhnA family [Nakamurella panacisegetis]